jgi:hypothetical protein
LAQGNTGAAHDYITAVANWVLAGNAQKFWDPWIIYLSSCRVLAALQVEEKARTILAEAYGLLHDRANEISDEHLRACFLTKVATNRELEEMWQAAQEREDQK